MMATEELIIVISVQRRDIEMEPEIELRGNFNKTSVLQKLNFFDSADTETPLSDGAVLLIYMIAYITLFALVLLFRLIIKWNKNRVQVCSDQCRGCINECYWLLKRACCCHWCCCCPIYFQGEYWATKGLFGRAGEGDVESADNCQPCCPCDRLSCGCHRPSCHAIDCLCCVVQCRRHAPTNPRKEAIEIV